MDDETKLTGSEIDYLIEAAAISRDESAFLAKEPGQRWADAHRGEVVMLERIIEKLEAMKNALGAAPLVENLSIDKEFDRTEIYEVTIQYKDEDSPIGVLMTNAGSPDDLPQGYSDEDIYFYGIELDALKRMAANSEKSYEDWEVLDAELKEEFSDPSTGIQAVREIQRHSQQKKDSADKGVSLQDEARDARDASGELGGNDEKPHTQER